MMSFLLESFCGVLDYGNLGRLSAFGLIQGITNYHLQIKIQNMTRKVYLPIGLNVQMILKIVITGRLFKLTLPIQ